MTAKTPPDPVSPEGRAAVRKPPGGAEPAEEEAWIRGRVERARRGDREAFGDLYRHFGRLVHGILLAGAPPGEVPDLVQEVFLLALRKLRSLREASAFGPWLATLARRVAVDHRRSRRWRYERQEGAGPGPPAGRPAVTADGLAVLEALSKLPAAYRETLLLRLVEGMSGREIAAATGLTEGSVRVNLSRGMKRLRAALEGGGDV